MISMQAMMCTHGRRLDDEGMADKLVSEVQATAGVQALF